MKNIKIIRSVYKVTRCIMEPVPNPKTGRLPDNVRKVDSKGDMILSAEDKNISTDLLIPETASIEIFDGKEFNLDDPYDAAWWNAIKDSRLIAKERGAKNEHGVFIIDGNASRYGTAEFYVETPGRDAAIKIERKRKTHQALAFIFGDTSQGLYTKARLIGGSMNGLAVDEVIEYLSDIADKNPEEILKVYTGEDIHLHILLADALEKHVIRYKNKQIYIFGEGTILGASEDSVINWMKLPNNKAIVDLIKSETYPEHYDTPVVTEEINIETFVEQPKRRTGQTK